MRIINEQILNIYEEGELSQGPTIRNFRIVHTLRGEHPQKIP